jgi:hypothetical protein
MHPIKLEVIYQGCYEVPPFLANVCSKIEQAVKDQRSYESERRVGV